MKITVVGRQMTVRDSLKDMAEKKLAKLDKFFRGEAEATVSFSHKHDRECLEVTISAANTAPILIPIPFPSWDFWRRLTSKTAR